MTYATFNAYHLGDNLIHLHFMRKMAQAYPAAQFAHHAPAVHRTQLAPLVADLPNLSLADRFPLNAINAWRGDMGFWYGHTQRNEFTRFHFDWFAHLAAKMHLDSPIRKAEDMLFDYPAIIEAAQPTAPIDYLVINSAPHSGQMRSFSHQDFNRLISHLMQKGSVVTTRPSETAAPSTNDGASGMSVTGIGAYSIRARCIVGVATGPIWPTFNIWNREVPRVILLDDERIHLTPNVQHVRTCGEAMEIL